MAISGHVENGVVVFNAGVSLPEGTVVEIVPKLNQPEAVHPGTGDWDAAARAARELRETGYDFDAWQKQREYDRKHTLDHLP